MRSWLALVLCLGALQVSGQPYHRRIPPATMTEEHARLLALYERAIFDSSVYQSRHLRPLRPLTHDENGEVLVATATSLDGNVGELLPIHGAGVWVTGVPEVRDICRNFTGDVAMQLRQLLGLPPDAHIPRILVLRARAADIFRPAVSPDVSTTSPCERLPDAPTPADCGNLFPSDTSSAHYAWIAQQSFALHQWPNGYPWTHLGYTYNWKPGQDRYGTSEYVIRPGAPVVIRENTTPEAYCAPTQR